MIWHAAQTINTLIVPAQPVCTTEKTLAKRVASVVMSVATL